RVVESGGDETADVDGAASGVVAGGADVEEELVAVSVGGVRTHRQPVRRVLEVDKVEVDAADEGKWVTPGSPLAEDRNALSARLRTRDEEEWTTAGDGNDGPLEIGGEDRTCAVGNAIAVGVDQSLELAGRGEETAVAVRDARGHEKRAVRKVRHP